MKINKTIKEILQGSNVQIQDEAAKTCKKHALPENVKKIGYLCRLHVKFTSLKHYKTKLADIVKINEKIFDKKRKSK